MCPFCSKYFIQRKYSKDFSDGECRGVLESDTKISKFLRIYRFFMMESLPWKTPWLFKAFITMPYGKWWHWTFTSATHSSKCFIWINAFSHHHITIIHISQMRRENGTQELCNLPKVTQWVCGRAWHRQPDSRAHTFNPVVTSHGRLLNEQVMNIQMF